MTDQPAAIELTGDCARLSGDWSLPSLAGVEAALARVRWPQGGVRFDLQGLGALDTAGAWLLQRTVLDLRRQGRAVQLSGLPQRFRPLLAAVSGVAEQASTHPRPRELNWVEAVGERTVDLFRQYYGLLSFLGEMALVLLGLLRHPGRFRWKLFLHNIGEAGYRAIPIVGLLSFLLGVVIAYQGGVLLRQYGADVFIADLVGLSLLRELAPLIAAIIVAGRTGSAFAAQIGTMKVTEEVSALQVIGMNPMEVLVVPKVLALVVSLTLLTVFADVMGVLGGMVIAQSILGISPVTFMDRVGESVTAASFFIGVGKAPVFAAIIAWIGCFQGFQVSAGAEMVGRRTTSAVVQSIFLVIVVDAVFSVIFSELGI